MSISNSCTMHIQSTLKHFSPLCLSGTILYGDVAQLVEQQAFNLRVKGSNPFIFTSPKGQEQTSMMVSIRGCNSTVRGICVVGASPATLSKRWFSCRSELKQKHQNVAMVERQTRQTQNLLIAISYRFKSD